MVEGDGGGEQSMQVIVGTVLVSNRFLTPATYLHMYIPSRQQRRTSDSIAL